jgi:hypothetical protein
MSVGAVMWGGIAEHWKIPDALTGAAIAMGIGIVMMKRYSVAAISDLIREPLPVPAPEVSVPISDDSGPVLVTIEYRIDPARSREFEEAMAGLRIIRRRDGATFWGLFFDAAEPDRYLEHFVVDSWIEHRRQHERLTLADQYIRDRVLDFQLNGQQPSVTHEIAAEAFRGR